MRRYTSLLRYELKNIVRDNMTLIMLLYPLILIVIGAFVLPVLIENYGDDPAGQWMAALVVVIVLANVAPFAGAAMLGFSLLDHRDENTLDTIRVTSVSLGGYILFKTVYSSVLSANAAFWSIYGVKLLSGDRYAFGGVNLFDSFSVPSLIAYAVVAGLFTPVFALLLAALANNKIEGFAYMKSAGIIVLMPAVLVLDAMQDFKQYFIGVVPTFWPTKGLLVDAQLLNHAHNLSFPLYLMIGVLYCGLLSLGTYRIFKRRLT